MSSSRISSLDVGRSLAILAVIALHGTPVMVTPAFIGESWFTNIMNQSMRFAVPLFFILSGYFIQPKLSQTPLLTVRHYCLPLVRLWLAWCLVYLLMPSRLDLLIGEGYLIERQASWEQLLQTPLNSLLEGTMVHLWFLPGLICAVLIIALLAHINRLSALLPVALVLYGYGLLGGSYESLSGIEAPFFTRNGPFFSTLMVAIGFEARRRDFHLNLKLAAVLAVTGMLGHLLEAYWLYGRGIPFVSHDFLLMTPLWGLGLFYVLLNVPKLGEGGLLVKLSPDVLGIYLVHFVFLIIYINLSLMLGVPPVVNILLLVPVLLLCSLGTVRLIARTPLRRLLLR